MELEDAVHALPEIYQPVYGHEYKFKYKRESVDRLNKIKTVCKNLQSHLKRKLHILDVGCAQGYLSFNLSKHCKTIDAVDGCLQNIKLCNLIKREFNFKNINFHHTDILNFEILHEYDLVIICNVIHHICHQKSVEITLEFLRKISYKSKVSLLELTNCDENHEWSFSLPESNNTFTDIFEFTDTICEFTNHLNDKKRPLILGSNSLAYFNESFFVIDQKLTLSHKFERNVHKGLKSYFYCGDKIIKQYKSIEDNRLREELQKEKSFYNLHVDNILNNALIYNEITSTFLVRDKISGILLYDFLKKAKTPTKVLITRKIIRQLAYYEDKGFYHNDLRLWNILVDKKNNVHIIDYSSFNRTSKDVLGNSIYFSFSVLLAEIFRLDLLDFPFRLLPEDSDVPESVSSLIIYIIYNLNKITFCELDQNYEKISELIFTKYDLSILSEFKYINNYLLSYYHYNQSFILETEQIKKQLNYYIKDFNKLSESYNDLVHKSNYYETSYHHFNRVITELKKQKYDLVCELETNKQELSNLETSFFLFKSRIKSISVISFIAILTLIYYFVN